MKEEKKVNVGFLDQTSQYSWRDKQYLLIGLKSTRIINEIIYILKCPQMWHIIGQIEQILKQN